MKSNCKRHFFGNVVVKKIVVIMTYELSKLKRSKMIRYLDEMTVEYNKKCKYLLELLCWVRMMLEHLQLF